MPVIQRVIKPTTHKGKRALIKKEPKIIENPKQTLFVRGRNVSDLVSKFMKDLHVLRKPDSLMLSRKNDIVPFEDFVPLERLCNKHDTSLFIFGSHNKKRPNNLIFGRLFDGHLLDMFEFGVISYTKNLMAESGFKPSVGVKPILLFIGEEFEQIHHLKRLRSLLVDMFHRNALKSAPYGAPEYVLSFVALEESIAIRTYRINAPQGEGVSRVSLDEMGPNVNLQLRRKIIASNDLFKKACRKPKIIGKKIQNIKRDVFGSKLGRVHMGSQNIQKLQTRKMKGLKKTQSEKREQRKRKSDNENRSGPPPQKRSK